MTYLEADLKSASKDNVDDGTKFCHFTSEKYALTFVKNVIFLCVILRNQELY